MPVSIPIVSLTPTIVKNSSKMALVPSKAEENDPVYQLIQARQDELGGITIRELARRTGVHHTTIAKQKNRESEPLLSTIQDMAKVANVSETVMFEAYAGKKPDPASLKAAKLRRALAVYEAHPEIHEKLEYPVQQLIHETEKIKEPKKD